MKFLLDAHIPPRLARVLRGLGHDAILVRWMPNRNATSDDDISALADLHERVVVTNDDGFRTSHLASGHPARVLLLKTGNLRRDDAIELIVSELTAIKSLFANPNCGELRLTGLTKCP